MIFIDNLPKFFYLIEGKKIRILKCENSFIYFLNSHINMNSSNILIESSKSQIFINGCFFKSVFFELIENRVNIIQTSFSNERDSEKSILYCIDCPLIIIKSSTISNNMIKNNNTNGGVLNIISNEKYNRNLFRKFKLF